MATISSFLLCFCFFFLFAQIKKQQKRNARYVIDTIIFLDQRNRELRDRDQKWLFDSLYSMNKSVKLPETVAVEKMKKPATIISPKANWRAEFRGDLDDFHG